MSEIGRPPARALFSSRLYAILDPEQCRGRSWQSVLDLLLGAGVSVLQLRAKQLPARDFLAIARRARAQTRARGCALIVNDRADIALAVDADGVHLGQEDLPLAAARRIMGGKLVGISTHDARQARAAEAGGADYIGFGPVFETATKRTGYPARGLEMLREIRREIQIPIVAIGGINEENAAAVWQAGADAAAMISELLQAEDIAGKVRRILSLR